MKYLSTVANHEKRFLCCDCS